MLSDSGRKVVICIPNLNVFGGTETHTIHLARGLASSGRQVEICNYFLADRKVTDQFAEMGIPVTNLKIKNQSLPDTFSALLAFFCKAKPNSVHVQYLAPGLVPIVAAKAAGVRSVVATLHQPSWFFGRKAKVCMNLAAWLADILVCNSLATEKSWFGTLASCELIKLHKRPKGHLTIYNGVESSYSLPVDSNINTTCVRDEYALSKVPLIGVVGRLRNEKGHDMLIKMMPQIIASCPTVSLIVVGEGDAREELICLARKLKVDNHIYWLGQRSPIDLRRLYAAMDLVVVPSRYEGFGYAAAEAMAAAKPIVAFDVDGLSEVVNSGVTGYLVKPYDILGFATRVQCLLMDKTKAAEMGAAARAKVKKDFSLDLFTEKMLKLYDLIEAKS